MFVSIVRFVFFSVVYCFSISFCIQERSFIFVQIVDVFFGGAVFQLYIVVRISRRSCTFVMIAVVVLFIFRYWLVIGVFIQASGFMFAICVLSVLFSGVIWFSISFCILGRSFFFVLNVVVVFVRGGFWLFISVVLGFKIVVLDLLQGSLVRRVVFCRMGLKCISLFYFMERFREGKEKFQIIQGRVRIIIQVLCYMDLNFSIFYYIGCFIYCVFRIDSFIRRGDIWLKFFKLFYFKRICMCEY